jgi:hypothetical protein
MEPFVKRKPLLRPRTIASHSQQNRCIYCLLLMWCSNPSAFAAQHGLTLKQVRNLQCSGEHLKSHLDGGTADCRNIAAACLTCNRRRHRMKLAFDPPYYFLYVQTKLAQGKWHPAAVVAALGMAPGEVTARQAHHEALTLRFAALRDTQFVSEHCPQRDDAGLVAGAVGPFELRDMTLTGAHAAPPKPAEQVRLPPEI